MPKFAHFGGKSRFDNLLRLIYYKNCDIIILTSRYTKENPKMNVNILSFGATTRLQNNSHAIQAAIDHCASNGGGIVTIPSGRFVSGTIYLRNNIELYLEAGAVLKASKNPDDYNDLDAYPQNSISKVEGWDYRQLVIAHKVSNVAITGLGKIEGCAEYWYGKVHVNDRFVWRDGFATTKGIKNGKLRPGKLIVFIESSNIKVTDVTITNSTAWSCLFHGCTNVQVRGVKIFNNRVHANTDGLDIDSCHYVTVSDCIIDTGDDCIAIRGSAARLSDPTVTCEHITITNCVLGCSVNAFRIGVGYGKISHVRVSNISIYYAGTAIDFNTSYCNIGHCELDDINFSNISATNLAHAFTLDTSDVPVSRVTIENFRAECMAGSRVMAQVPNIMSDITLRGIDFFVKPTHVELTPKVRKQRGEYVLDCANVSELRTEGIRFFFDDSVKELWSGDINITNA